MIPAAFPESQVNTGAEIRGTISKRQGRGFSKRELSANQRPGRFTDARSDFNTPIIFVQPQCFQLSCWTRTDGLHHRRDAGAWPPAATGAQLPDDAGDYRQNDQQQSDRHHAIRSRQCRRCLPARYGIGHPCRADSAAAGCVQPPSCDEKRRAARFPAQRRFR